jgi:ABC-2 type transport system permease protein
VTAALHAEWTKLRTSPGTLWLLLGIVAATVGLSVAAAGAFACRTNCATDLTKLSLTGVQLGQAAVAIVAVLAIGNEYSTGMVRTSLTAVPRRTRVFVAKAGVVAAVVGLAAAVAVAGSLLVARMLLPAHELVWRSAVGSVLYLELIALLSLGLATAVRNPAAAVGIVLGLLYVWPVVARVVTDRTWERHLQQAGPMSAGLAVQATKNLTTLPIGPWAGLGVLGLWALGGLLAGWLLLVARDA